MVKWDPKEYATHSSAQLQWARELIARLDLRGDERVLDVGCGDGKITAEIARHLPKGSAVGVDRSPEMIAFARGFFPPSQYANLEFFRMDARSLQFDRPFDIAFSNAALHWVDDHRAVLRGLSQALRLGGRLVLSFGGRGNAAAILDVFEDRVRKGPWHNYFETFHFAYAFLGPEEYRPWLEACGFSASVCRLAEKDMVHDGLEGLTGWIRTTWLPYTERVPEDRREDFIRDIARQYVATHPLDANGKAHVGMVRLEVDATRTR